MTEDKLKRHLTAEEIIDFVSFGAVNEETLALASRVNGHIRECAECRKKVSAFGDVYDELCRIYGEAEAKDAVYCIMDDADYNMLEEKEIAEALSVIKAKLGESSY